MDRSDYVEPACPFDVSMWTNEPSETIPAGRVIEKEDELLSVSDYDGAVRLLQYWLAEAEAIRDVRGAFTVENELTGVYRKMGKGAEAIAHGKRAVGLSHHELIGDGSVSQATSFINLATAYKAFGQAIDAVPLYEEAKKIYEREIRPGDGRLGGLYNNFALALSDVGRCDEAIALYQKALDWMETVPKGKLEQGMTYLNLCDVVMARDARFLTPDGKETDESDPEAVLTISKETDEQIQRYLDLSWDCLNDPSLPADGYYAFVAETSAEVFRDYGRENEAIAFTRIAEEIRESFRGK